MISIEELESQLLKLQQELYVCIQTNDNTEIVRITTGISVIKDTLLESYRKSYTSNVVCPVITSNVNITKYAPSDFSSPFRIVK